jgi:predicted permease
MPVNPKDDTTRRRAAVEQDVDAELAFHRRATIDELMAAGATRASAEAEADRRFGPQRPHRQRIVAVDLESDGPSFLSTAGSVLVTSFRAVIRDLVRSPGFALGVIAVLTLGVGLNAVTAGFVDRLVLSSPAGLVAPEQLRRAVVVARGASGEESLPPLSYRDYQDLLTANDLAGAAAETSGSMLFGSGDQVESIRTVLVTANYFPVLGVTPSVGRFFSDHESSVEGARLVVLGHAFWERRFGGDPSVIGQPVRIKDHIYTVVGVTPTGFTGSSVQRADAFLPLESAADERVSGPWRTERGFRWLGAVVRLKPGGSPDAVAAEMTARFANDTGTTKRDITSRMMLAPLQALTGATASAETSIAALIGGVALVVLLIALTNLANLFLARSLARRDQLALRIALGGARWRLVAAEAAEGGWLALLGIGAAWLVASAITPFLRNLLFPRVDWVEAGVGWTTLVPLFAVTVCAGALAAALPMWRASRGDVAGWLKQGTQRGPRPRTGAQNAMLIVQGALSVLLLAGAGLFVRSMTAAESLNLGLDTDVVMQVFTVAGDSPLPVDFTDRLAAAARRTPGVASVVRVAGTIPFQGSWSEGLFVPGLDPVPRVEGGGPYLHAVDPGYFATVGTPIISGRPFADTDRAASERVVIVGRTMARLYWPGRDPIGACVAIVTRDAPCATVVGVAEDSRRQALIESDQLQFYVPLEQSPESMRANPRLLVRLTDADGGAPVAESLRREALSLAPSLRQASARTIDDLISPQLRSWRLGAGLFGVFGALALLVATVGLYSVVAFHVEGRRKEMGLRAALGATSASLVGLVVREGLRASVGGLVLGLFLAWLMAPLVASFLYGVEPQDTSSFAGAGLLLLLATLVASAVPAMRAGRVDPPIALREE